MFGSLLLMDREKSLIENMKEKIEEMGYVGNSEALMANIVLYANKLNREVTLTHTENDTSKY